MAQFRLAGSRRIAVACSREGVVAMSTFSSCSGIPRPRVVAPVVMALLASGLVLLGFAPDSGSVAVPEGAKAGDLVIHRCDYATEDASQAADCGTHVVPQNRAGSQSRLISTTGDPPGSAVGSVSGAGLLP